MSYAIFVSTASLVVLGYLIAYLHDCVKASQALNWPSVQALVISSQALQGCIKGNGYYPEIHYTYTVAGARYENDRLAYGMADCGSEESAQATARRYVVGSNTEVHFNPSSPADSVIVVGEVGGATWGVIAIMSPIFIFWSFLSWWSIRALRTRRGA